MKEELKKVGLTEGESGVYLALLKIGSSTVGPVVKESRVSYSKIYEVLGRLIEKGIVSYTLIDKTKYFQAVEPNKLKDFLKNKKEEIIKDMELLDKVLPRLEGLSKGKERQSAEIFIGIKGLKTAYEVLLKEHSKSIPLHFLYVHDEKYAEITSEFYEKLFYYFKELKIKLKGINTSNIKKSKHFKKPPKFIDLRFVDFPLPLTVDIYKDKVLLTTWRNKPFAYLITSKEISENFMKYFEELWKIAKK
jgi:sugar-specific transcriptional regulator TrmB